MPPGSIASRGLLLACTGTVGVLAEKAILVGSRAITAQKIVALVTAALEGDTKRITMLSVSRAVIAVIAGVNRYTRNIYNQIRHLHIRCIFSI